MKIALRRLETVPEYFTARPVPAATSQGAWVQDVRMALCFATHRDASDFVKMALRHEEPFISFVDLDTREGIE